MNSTKVVNLKTSKYDVYIGRKGKGKDGYFGNPIRVGYICDVCGSKHNTPGSTIFCFEVYFRQRIKSDEMFREMVGQLKGKRLGCFCKPEPCHGDIIKDYLDD
jgi:hypothetical protein